MGFDDGAHLALFSPKQEPQLKRSAFPVALIYTPDLQGLVIRMQDAKYPVRMLDAAQSGPFQIDWRSRRCQRAGTPWSPFIPQSSKLC